MYCRDVKSSFLFSERKPTYIEVESKILIGIFESKNIWNENWKKFHNKEFQRLYHSLIIVRMNKSIRLRCASHVVRMDNSKKKKNL